MIADMKTELDEIANGLEKIDRALLASTEQWKLGHNDLMMSLIMEAKNESGRLIEKFVDKEGYQ